jgi:quercetin dioxygenase-like cupin family protein
LRLKGSSRVNFTSFSDSMKKQGFDQVVERVWKPLTTFEEHSRPFDAKAVIVQGEMWLTVNGHTEHLVPGGTFELSANLPHAERYGSEGATYWVARRNVPPRR